MSGALHGARVLVPRAGAWGERVRADLASRGAEAVVAPLISSAPPRDTTTRDRAFAALADGAYAWLFVTSAASVEQLRQHGVVIPATTRIAAVGRATARAVADAGWEVDFVPAGASSAVALVTQWCAARTPAMTGRALVVRSDLAQAVVSDELEVRGFAVDVCIAYRTIGVDLAPAVVEWLRSGHIGVVLLTSLSVGRELRRQVGGLPASTLVASIGPGTTRDATALGFTVGHTAQSQSIDALIAELDARVLSEKSS
ncbi:uroporphyrinogen-III synthase/uroporphyrinogen III methyltransferase / synthase [Microbacterium sp. LKL04]|uniref:uroporphyrinogen-III synthase n=1 Tax=Microbacterium sp. LKL04 TaxID=912630 RepID=UPI000875D59A|nr:uroporphyrinogen-III synthase [Microbacterium sp. LKL04]SCY31115.1 uroporphyrinogen-III synthase/uroporphyrinogen III methyltransferase / synthase [Microbacterium sp. LKL04]